MLLHPISLITQTPHHYLLYANGLSLLRWLSTEEVGGRRVSTSGKTLQTELLLFFMSQSSGLFLQKRPTLFTVVLIYSKERRLTQLRSVCFCTNLHHLPKGEQINEYSHLIYSPRQPCIIHELLLVYFFFLWYHTHVCFVITNHNFIFSSLHFCKWRLHLFSKACRKSLRGTGDWCLQHPTVFNLTANAELCLQQRHRCNYIPNLTLCLQVLAEFSCQPGPGLSLSCWGLRGAALKT